MGTSDPTLPMSRRHCGPKYPRSPEEVSTKSWKAGLLRMRTTSRPTIYLPAKICSSVDLPAQPHRYKSSNNIQRHPMRQADRAMPWLSLNLSVLHQNSYGGGALTCAIGSYQQATAAPAICQVAVAESGITSFVLCLQSRTAKALLSTVYKQRLAQRQFHGVLTIAFELKQTISDTKISHLGKCSEKSLIKAGQPGYENCKEFTVMACASALPRLVAALSGAAKLEALASIPQ